MDDNTSSPRKASKRCMTRDCKFNENCQNGIPDCYKTCPICQAKLEFVKKETNVVTSVPYSDVDVAAELSPIHLVDTSPISSRPSEVKVIFRTIMIKQQFHSIHGVITIRLHGNIFGNFEDDNTCLKPTGEIEYKKKCFVILEGFLIIPDLIFQIANAQVEFGLPYKYFLNGKEESLKYFRCLYLNAGQVKNIIYKHDIMVISEANLIDENSFLMEETCKGQITFNIFANLTLNEKIFTFEEQVSTFKNIANDIFDMIVIPKNSEIELGIVGPENCRRITPLFNFDNEGRTKLIEKQIRNANTAQALLKKFIFILLLFHKEELNANYENILKLILNAISLDIVEKLIRKKSFCYDHFQDYQQSIQHLQSSFEIIVFKTPQVSDKQIVIRFLPLYHSLFKLSIEFERLHKNQEWLASEYWGFPYNVGIISFYPFQDLEFLELLLDKFSQYDQILSYSILLISMNEKNFQRLSTNHMIPIVSYLTALVYRIKNWPLGLSPITLRSQIFSFLFSKLNREPQCITETQLDQICNAVFFLWDINVGRAISHEPNSTDDGFLHLNLTTTILRMLVNNKPNIFSIETIKSGQIPFKYFKSSEELLNIFLQTFEILIIKRYFPLTRIIEKLKLWSALFSFEFPESYNWNSVVESRFKSMVQEFDMLITIKVFIHLLTNCNILDEIYPTFKERMIVFLKTKQDQASQETILSYLVKLPNAVYSELIEILNPIYLQQRQAFEDNPAMHILSWSPWCILFDFNWPESQNKNQEIVQLMKTAYFEYTNLCKSLKEMTIQVKILRILHKFKKRFLDIHDTLSQKYLQENLCSGSSIRNVIYEVLEILTYFDEQKKFICNFNYILNFASHLLESQEIKDFFLIDFEAQPLNEICGRSSSGDFRILPNSILASNLNTPHVQTMLTTSFELKNSYIFLNAFKNLVSSNYDFVQTKILEMGNIYDEIWQPTFLKCEVLVSTLFNREISLILVDLHFGIIREAEEKMRSEIKYLSSAITLVNGHEMPSVDQINSSARVLIQYFKFQETCELASLINEVHSEYCQRGDFKQIDILVNLKNHQFTKENTLKIITNDLENLTLQLSQYENFTRSLISSFVSHPDFIKWARDTLKDRQQMKVFIDLALTSCGENDFNINRITCLRSVCFNLAPLIFDMHPECGYKQFLNLLNDVIEQIGERERFLNTFNEAANLLHLWKHMELTHSSVGKSTIQELADILESGFIEIQFDTVNNNDNGIQLHIPDPINRIYSLEGLKDLKGKIALIKAETKTTKDNDLFSSIFESTMEIYLLVEKLINLGHISYVNYFKKFKCNFQALSILSKEIESGNKELGNWYNTLNHARLEFYSLNFYTNVQILFLRRDLKIFHSTNFLNPQIFHLLSFLNPNITLDGISIEMNNVLHPLPCISNEFQETVNDSVIPEPVDSLPLDRFPSHFSEDDKKLCLSLFEEQEIDINLSIIGIKQFKRDLKEYDDMELTEFCLNNTGLLDNAPEEVSEDKVEPCTELKIPFDESVQLFDEYHLSLKDLSIFLEAIRMNCPKIHRHLPNTCKSGNPNLIFVPNETIYYFTLSQYILCNGEDLLPSSQEMIICEADTALEEIDIFFRRAIFDSHSYYLFSLLFVERLKYEVAVQSIELLKKYMSYVNNPKYNLFLICSAEFENKSYFASAIYKHKRITPPFLDHDILKDTIFKRFAFQEDCTLNNETQLLPAWFIDQHKSKLRIFTSHSVGAGKSLAINCLVTELEQLNNLVKGTNCSFTIPLHGGKVMESEIVKKLISSEIGERVIPYLFHFDLASTITDEVIPFLFKLLILGNLKDRFGNIWSCKSTDYYTVEITLAQKNSNLTRFCELFPNTMCLQPKPALETMRENKLCNDITLNDNQFKSPLFQRVYMYLHTKEMKQKLENFTYKGMSGVYGNPIQFMEIILKYCGLENPSWGELSYFIHFLSHQFYSCEENVYYQTALLEDDWKGFRTFLINMIIPMSRDIATPSLSNTFDNSSQDLLGGYSIESRRRWEHKNLPYLYLNEDRQSMTFFGINISKSLKLLDPSDPSKVLEKKIIPKSLYSTLTKNLVNFQDDCYKWDKEKKISVLANVIGIETYSELISQQTAVQDPDPSYVLTIDNLKKILAIHMRFRCNIPVIIMGETGCGKTRLVYYMCQLQSQFVDRVNMRVLKIHGGTTHLDIIRELTESIKLAEENVRYNIDTVLFFDEANTCHSIGLIKEILCDRRINGNLIPNNIRLQFVAACNPYRRHSNEMLIKLMSAGLGKVSFHKEITEKFGKIPLRELVYRVVELPKSLLPLVWDFGQLNKEVEESYIREIIIRHLDKSPIYLTPSLLERITEILTVTQEYMRYRTDECSFVSLRDVERTLRVMLWFFEKIPIFVINLSLDRISTSLLLSLSVCYRARLKYRRTYDAKLVNSFKLPLSCLKGEYVIIEEIERFQSVITDSMKIGEHIAKNSSLKENLFMMFVCIELRIPLFIIGKPGSSKSLAKAIINISMEGKVSPQNSKMKYFKQVEMLSYQCSQLSTSEGILNLFKTCKIIQNREDPDKFVSCVVLEEVGLAEDSPLLPLKVLHPLLDDDPSFIGNLETQPQSCNNSKVAFIGLSNWALDPAKMNRGIMVCLEDPYREELILSAKAICETNLEESIHMPKLVTFIKGLVTGYFELIQVQREKVELQYFGLRDFYSLIKMLYHICREENTPLNSTILRHAVTRNFGGLEGLDPFEIFKKHLYLSEETTRGPPCTPLELINANLKSHQSCFYARNRYLLLLTENYSALDIIRQAKLLNKNDLRIIFGSNFPNDSEYSTICRNINLIKNYIETGKTMILTNLLNLYESLYDVLNQYYFESLGKFWVDIGLGTHRVKCSVDPNFKLIVIADYSTVYEHFPSALINRFEKHTLTVSSVLSEEEKEMVTELSSWAVTFAKVDLSDYIIKSYPVGDCIIGYQEDTISKIIYSLVNTSREETVQQFSKASIIDKSRIKLIKMSTPDSILRLSKTKLRGEADTILNTYLSLPLQDLKIYLEHIFTSLDFFSIITTHSMLLSESEVYDMEQSILKSEFVVSLQVLYLLQFQTNQQFSNHIDGLLNTNLPKEGNYIILLQCEDANLHSDLIAYARHHVIEQFNKIQYIKTCNVFFVIVVRMSGQANRLSSYCGGVWETVHIDELRPPDLTILPSFTDLINLSLSEIFSGKSKVMEYSRLPTFNQGARLLSTVQPAFSLLLEQKGSQLRTLKRINQFISLLHDTDFAVVSAKICAIISDLLDNKSAPIYSKEWSRFAAFEEHLIYSAGTFRKALSKEIDKALAPLVAVTLSYLDRNGNIDLIFSLKNPAIQEIWRNIFLDQHSFFNHSQSLTILSSQRKRSVPVISDGWNGKFFQSCFPFSWLIVYKINETMNKMKTHSGISEMWIEFEEAFEKTIIGELISSVNVQFQENTVAFNYLDDFINLVIYPKDIIEHKVHYLIILDGVLNLKHLIKKQGCISSPEETTQSKYGVMSLSIPMIHVVYEMLVNRLSFVKQSFSLQFNMKEEIKKQIEQSIDNDCDGKLGKDIDIIIFEVIVSHCLPDMDIILTNTDWDIWVLKVRRCQPIIESNFEIIILDPEKRRTLRSQWNSIQAILIFVTNFVLQSDYDMKASLRQFYKMACTKDSNFHSAKTIKRVFAVLNALTRKICIDISQRLNITCFKCNKPPPDAIALSCLHFRCRTCAPTISADAKCSHCAEDIYAAVVASEREVFKNNCREMLQKQMEFRKKSTDFIMEILSAITFSSFGNESDEIDLIEYLVAYVALDQNVLEILPESQDDDISLFQQGILKPSPTVRLFLLQILIRNRFHFLRKTLSGYMGLTFSQLQPKQEYSVYEKLVLFVQCFEDYYHSKFFSLPSESLRIHYVSSFCFADRRLEHFKPLYESEISLAYVESISLMRFIVLTICQWVIDKLDLKREVLNLFIDQDETFQRIKQKKTLLGIHFKQLIQLYQELYQSVKCSDYLNLFFLKTLYSQMGWGGMKSILSNEELEWIVPTKKVQKFNFEGQLDLFSSFGQSYQGARKAIHYLITQGDKQYLVEYLYIQKQQKASRINLHRNVIFAVFTEIFIRNLNNDHHILFSYQIQSFLITIENEIVNMPIQLLDLMDQLLKNTLFNGHIPELVLSPKSHGYTSTIAGLLCHIGVLLHYALDSGKENLLSPLTLIYMEPDKLNQKLFPTMKNMDSSVTSIKMAISENGRWYECPNGHSYFIGECGKPWTVCSCPECGVTIGGDFHQLHHGNMEQQRYTGHILGHPSERYHSQSGIRRISATSVAVIRVLMHGIFIWASGIKYHLDPTQLISLTEHVGNMNPSNFYFLHMIFDIHDISNASGKDFEESALVVHLIIDRILNCKENMVMIDTVLTSNVLRETWEFFFDKYFISPILSNIDGLFDEKISHIRSDVVLSNHTILRSIYEKDTDPSQPHGYLWRFRSKIDFQHCSKAFNSQGLEKSIYFPLLARFIQEEHLLTATQFLPAIVKLQSKLAQKNYKFTKNIPSHRTIQFFLRKLEEDEGESAMEEFKYLINEFASAWKIVGSEVIQRKGLNMQFSEINFNETPLQFILPISTPSSTMMALTEILVDVHNLFIIEQKKYSIIQDKHKESEDTIYLSQLSKYHLINYQSHLDKLILSNARYSLHFGEGTIVKYDYSTIERQLVDNFIRSKPLILWDFSKPGVITNSVNQTMFERIEELIPQEELDEALAKRIVTELQNIGNISEVLDLVEVVIGFAGSAGGFQDHKIKSYLHDVLKYPEGEHLQSDTANASCFMKHLVWLWKNLSVVRAILFVKHNQHPFASLPEHFYTQLNLEQNREFKSNLNLLPLQDLLFALHDFVFFFLRNLDGAQAQYPLYDCYSEYFKLMHGKEPDFFPPNIFTKDILVSHTIHVWTILAQEFEPW